MTHRTALNLTPRQILYLRAVCKGDSRQEIADEAYVSYETVRNTLGTVYRQLGTRNAAGACYALGMADQRQAIDDATWLAEAE